MKLPSLQWYPSDWLRDPAVRALTLEARAVWFDLLMHMHACEPRGKLVLNGAAIPEDALANMLGLDKQILTTHLKQILTLGVAGVEPSTGIIFSRRMMRDEELRQIRAKSGKMGGNPRLLNQIPTTGVKQKPTPSSSSSSSSSEEKKPPTPLPATPSASEQPDLNDAFGELWACYPKKGRTREMSCRAAYTQILEGLRGDALAAKIAEIHYPIDVGGAWYRSAKWRDGFVQNLETYLFQRQWREEPESAAEAKQPGMTEREAAAKRYEEIEDGWNEYRSVKK